MKPMFRVASLLLLAACPAVASEPPWAESHIGKTLSFAEAMNLTQTNLQALLDRGEMLFTAKFTVLDGAGRPKATQAIVPTKRKRGENAAFQRTGGPDASACSGCHNEPSPGGAGEFVANVFVSEGFESADFDSVDPQFSNERNTNAIMGNGLVELLAREMTADLQAERRAALKQARDTGKEVYAKLQTKGVSFGFITAKPDGVLDITKLDGIDTDLVVRPFSQKGVFTSLRQFTVNAMNQHHGMEADERFGVRWTGTDDFDEDGKAHELGDGDITAVTLWQATLPPPTVRTDVPANWKSAAAEGEKAFEALGCGECHKSTLPLKSMVFTDPGPFDAAGTMRAADVEASITVDLARQPWAAQLKQNDKGEWLIPLFGDLKRHVIVDEGINALGNEIMGQRFVERDVFMTAELWGIGSTAPYGHRGDITTLDGIIRSHGGAGRAARDAYVHSDETTRSNLIAFLKTLVIAE